MLDCQLKMWRKHVLNHLDDKFFLFDFCVHLILIDNISLKWHSN